MSAELRRQLGPKKVRAIELWRLAKNLRMTCVWNEPTIVAATKTLDEKAMAIAKENGFEYDDVAKYID